MSFWGKITLNTFASSAGRIAASLLALVSVGFITRGLGKAGFGEYATIVAYLSTFQILADLGLYSLLTKEIAQSPENEKKLVSNYFTLRLVSSALFLLAAVVLVFLFPYSQAVKVGAVFSASAFLFLSLSQIFLGVFQKHLSIYKASVSEFVGRAFQLGLVWYFFQAKSGLFAYLIALIAGAFLIFIINFLFVRKIVKFRLSFEFKEWKRILKTTLPIAASLVFTLLYFKADTILLSIMKSPEDVGIYSAAYKVLEAIIFFPAAFVGLMLPFLSKHAKEDKERFSKTFSRLFEIITASALPVVVGGSMLAYTIVYFIGGSDFLVSGLPLQVLFLAVGIIFFGTLFGNGVIALGLQRKAMWAYFAGFVFNFAANLIFIPKYSYMGAAWTTVLTELLVTIYLMRIIMGAIGFKIKPAVITKIAASAAAMGFVVFYFAIPLENPLRIPKFLAVFAIGTLLYGFFVWKFKILLRFKNLEV